MTNHWHRRFIQMAGLVSTWSKDPSTQVGCVLVRPESKVMISTGVNGMPRRIQEFNMVESGGHHGRPVMEPDGLHKTRWDRPQKYMYVEHAERNAIYNAALEGQSTRGCVAYMNWQPCPCADCARAFIQAGIIEVVGPNRPFAGAGNWGDSLKIADEMLREAGIKITVMADPT